MKQSLATFGLLAACLFCQAPMAQVLPIQPSEFAARRAALAKTIAEAFPNRRAVVLLRGGPKQPDMGTFAQDQDFLYLTGISEPAIAMLMIVDESGKLARDELLVPPYSPFSAKWDGSFLAPGEKTAKTTGFQTAGNVRSLRRRLTDLFEGRERPLLITNKKAGARLGSTPGKSVEAADSQKKDRFDGRTTREAAFIAAIKKAVSDVEVQSLERFVHKMRPTKSKAEIALITESTRIAAAGIGEAMKSCKPGAFEYQLAAVARCVYSLNGCGPDAYAAIVGAGPNGCILHYNACTRQLQDDDLIVMDYAGTLHGYCSDVTRTFPASGQFTPEQRKLVSDVHEVQQELIAMVKAGTRISELYGECARLLIARGYKNDHGPCHHVGLAVHDPSVDVLKPGMIITVEPGAYLPKKGYGCRIEDCVLVTEDGCVVLSGNVPSHPDAIEKWMQQEPTIPIALR